MTTGSTPRIDTTEAKVGLVTAKNYIINGAFDFWQRGTSFTTSDGYTADRFKMRNVGAVSPGVYQVGSEANPLGTWGYGPWLRLQATNTATGGVQLSHQIEYCMFKDLRGKTVTLSYVVAPTSDNAASRAFGVGVNWSATKDINIGWGVNSPTTIFFDAFTLATSYTLYTRTFVIPDTAKSLAIQFGSPAVTHAFQNGYGFDFAKVWLNEGPYSLPFQRAGGSYSGELLLCQRYCEVITSASGALESGSVDASFPVVTKRITPANANLSQSGVLTWHRPNADHQQSAPGFGIVGSPTPNGFMGRVSNMPSIQDKCYPVVMSGGSITIDCEF